MLESVLRPDPEDSLGVTVRNALAGGSGRGWRRVGGRGVDQAQEFEVEIGSALPHDVTDGRRDFWNDERFFRGYLAEGFGEVDWRFPSRSPAALPVAAAPMAPDKIARAVRRSMDVPFAAGAWMFEFVEPFRQKLTPIR
jgi:hypothetical protein